MATSLNLSSLYSIGLRGTTLVNEIAQQYRSRLVSEHSQHLSQPNGFMQQAPGGPAKEI